jgi:dihydroneopterin aldolase
VVCLLHADFTGFIHPPPLPSSKLWERFSQHCSCPIQDTMLPLNSSWEIAIAAGEPHSTIRVQNLQSVVQVGRDAWGRTGKAQPILISATISLREPFDKASTEDSVNNSSTVHYGILSKAILDAVESFSSKDPNHTLRALLTHILCHLTGAGLDAEESSSRRVNPSPVLEVTALKSLELKLVLPKASLIGSGVALSGTVLYAGSGNAEAHSTSLKLCGLRIPTLIGVNPNERLAKQIVVTNIELDLWSATSDLYNELEEVVVKVCYSSFFSS